MTDTSTKADGIHGHNPHIDLVIRATNGSPWPTDRFKGEDSVEEVVRKALQHFIKEGAMTDGAYDLVLVVDGVAGDPLHPGDQLEDLGIGDGAILALQPQEPQVDG
jgi:hypothetical protein